MISPRRSFEKYDNSNEVRRLKTAVLTFLTILPLSFAKTELPIKLNVFAKKEVISKIIQILNNRSSCPSENVEAPDSSFRP